MKTRIMLAWIALLLATAVQAQFLGTVRLVNGEKVSGYLLAERGKLLVMTAADTLQFSRAEISRVWRGAPAPKIDSSIRFNFFASWMPIIPDRMLGGMIGFNMGSKINHAANIGLFYHRGKGASTESDFIQNGIKIAEIKNRNEFSSHSAGVIYSKIINDHEIFFMVGQIENKYTAFIEQDGKRTRNPTADKTEKNFIFSIMETKSRVFFHIGATFKPEGIVAGLGVKI